MRNRVTTEFRKVEKDSDEYLELQAQRDANDGRPVWEETGIHDAIEQSKRLEDGVPLATDIGDAQQPVSTIAGGSNIVPASAVQHMDPLPSEREAGVEPFEGFSGLPASNPPDEEVVLVPGAMEDSTDTGTDGTEPDLTEHKAGKSADDEGGSGKKRSRKKSDSGGSGSGSSSEGSTS
jgi:hypothetical protein